MTADRSSPPSVKFKDVLAARKRIAAFVCRTPIMRSRTFDQLFGAQIFFKCECLQSSGAFKARGAHNAVFALTDAEAARGVATHSSGNHAAALALAARHRGIPAYIVMPSNSSRPKIEAVRRYGGRITLCAPTLAARERRGAELQAATGAAFVHAYDDSRVIAGQGTAALELMEDCPDLDAIMVPVGGGGLLSGTAVVAKARRSDVSVYGAEPVEADDASRSFRTGRLIAAKGSRTIADGLRTSLGRRNFAIVRTKVDDIVTVSEAGIVEAMRLAMAVLKLVIEPSAAVPLGALLEHKLRARPTRIGIILSGGNVDLARLPWRRPDFPG